MSNIYYLDEYLEPASEQQAKQAGNYVKQIMENGRVKISEGYSDHTLSGIDYYLDPGESMDAARVMYPDLVTSFFKNKVTRGDYTRYDIDVLDENGKLVDKRIEVVRDSPFPVYYKSMDPETNRVRVLDKTYYAANNVTYEFEYDMETGEFMRLTVHDPERIYDTDEITLYPETIGLGLNSYNFSWQGFEYYRHAEPVLPV